MRRRSSFLEGGVNYYSIVFPSNIRLIQMGTNLQTEQVIGRCRRQSLPTTVVSALWYEGANYHA
jgi:hypothetical protein